ncbi:malonate decarboxylase holo-ACP synthase [Pseudalkalibacillus hwajinpoensis]|uniref:malonate decarboxylase holo-ACP synthase n=1 Tax=Guptibacillus hwajinpoensis TaxID=208199 RepID=UPI00325B2ADC
MVIVLPHDLLRISSVNDLLEEEGPAWVSDFLLRAPFVVVRRALINEGLIPVGIRGEARNQRHASLLAEQKILERITPEQLAQGIGWKKYSRFRELPALQSLDLVEGLFASYNLSWGPTGSVGFELASGVATASKSSDLDIVIREPEGLSKAISKELTTELKKAPCHIDVQVETRYGAVALLEVASGGSTILIKRDKGPELIENVF